MQLLIDEIKLSLLLEKKKQYIGRTVTIDNIISSISFLLSVIFASYRDLWGIPGIIFKYFFIGLGIIFNVKFIYDIYKSKKNNYTYEDLLNDINKLNEITHNHSIVIIKDTYRKHPNKILVYDDKRWQCKLFLNYKDNENNESFICEHISSELKINVDQIELRFVTKEIHQKYSVSAGMNKLYSHKFYLAIIKEFPKYMKSSSFEKEGRRYYWKSISELEDDKNTMNKNADIINYVKSYF